MMIFNILRHPSGDQAPRTDSIRWNAGSIAVKGIQDQVDKMTDKERATYEGLDFDMETYKKEIGLT